MTISNEYAVLALVSVAILVAITAVRKLRRSTKGDYSGRPINDRYPGEPPHR